MRNTTTFKTTTRDDSNRLSGTDSRTIEHYHASGLALFDQTLRTARLMKVHTTPVPTAATLAAMKATGTTGPNGLHIARRVQRFRSFGEWRNLYRVTGKGEVAARYYRAPSTMPEAVRPEAYDEGVAATWGEFTRWRFDGSPEADMQIGQAVRWRRAARRAVTRTVHENLAGLSRADLDAVTRVHVADRAGTEVSDADLAVYEAAKLTDHGWADPSAIADKHHPVNNAAEGGLSTEGSSAVINDWLTATCPDINTEDRVMFLWHLGGHSDRQIAAATAGFAKPVKCHKTVASRRRFVITTMHERLATMSPDELDQVEALLDAMRAVWNNG